MIEEPRVLGGRYEVGELIGRGGMAEVHAGHDLRLGRTVAIKMLRSDLARDTSFLARFRREAQSAASLNHPAIVAVYDSGQQEVRESGGAAVSVPYIVMEHVDGRTLREVLNDESMFDPDEAARITAAVLGALEYSHERGIVHRDIKPANVMLTRSGAVKVMDFGIARALADTAATMTQTQAVLGTARYLSPEQAQGQDVDARSDLYSVGCLLYELLTGRTPFVGDPLALVYQHLGEAPKAPSSHQQDLTRELDAIALHALQKSPDQRYQTAGAFRDDLMAAIAGQALSEPAEATFARVGAAAGAAGLGAAAAGMATGTAAAALPTEVIGVRGYGGRHGGEGDGDGAWGSSGGGSDGPGNVAGADGAGPGGWPPYADRTSSGRFRPEDLGERTDEIPVREERHRGGYWMLAILGLLALAGIGWVVFQALGPGADEAVEPVMVSVPEVIGETELAATEILEAKGLVAEAAPAVAPELAGIVIDQTPLGNALVEEGSTVVITVSSGPDDQIVPELSGSDEVSARNLLEGMGLSVMEEAEEVNDPRFDKGKVVRTDPAAGEMVSPDDPITLFVASGQVEVPLVEGLDANEAIAELVDNRLTYTLTYEETSAQPPNRVLEQSIEAGTMVDYEEEVELTVAREPNVTVSPSAPVIVPPTSSPAPTTPTTTPTTPTTTPTTPTTTPTTPTTPASTPSTTAPAPTSEPAPTTTDPAPTTTTDPAPTTTTDPAPTTTTGPGPTPTTDPPSDTVPTTENRGGGPTGGGPPPREDPTGPGPTESEPTGTGATGGEPTGGAGP